MEKFDSLMEIFEFAGIHEAKEPLTHEQMNRNIEQCEAAWHIPVCGPDVPMFGYSGRLRGNVQRKHSQR